MSDSSILPAIISSISGLAGTIAGGFITYWATRAMKKADRAEEYRAAISGIAAELEAYVDLITWRDPSASINGILDGLNQGQNIPLTSFKQALGATGGPRDFFPLFFSNLDKIGALGEEAYDLAKFHTQLAGIFSTLDNAMLGTFDQLSIPQKAALLQRERDLCENTLKLGKHVVERMKTKAKTT